jgi:hypothetical protein
MKESPDEEVTQIERTLQKPTAQVRSFLSEDSVALLQTENSPEATITWHAVIERPGASKGVVANVAIWKASELYGYADSPLLEFHRWIAESLKLSAELQSLSEDDADFQLSAMSLWKKIEGLNNFFKISRLHDELITTLLQIRNAEVTTPLTKAKVFALKKTFELAKNNLRLTDELLDSMYERLEQGGFSIHGILTGVDIPCG